MRKLPRLYPILDAEALSAAGLSLIETAQALRQEGVRWVQYRDKVSSDAQVVDRMQQLRAIFPPDEATLLLNDRVHLCEHAEADGVHIGQQDMPPAKARKMLGPRRMLGVSTHSVQQLASAIATRAPDYLAIGPVFATRSKRDPDPVVGIAGVQAARALTRLPLVAIGGITRQNGRSVIEAGADAVAVISGLLPEPTAGGPASVAERVRDILEFLR